MDLNPALFSRQLYRDADGNEVIYESSPEFFPPNFSLNGRTNSIRIGKKSNLSQFGIRLQGSDNTVLIGSECRLIGQLQLRGNHTVVHIGSKTTFQKVNLYALEGCGITIGEDCMFSARIEIRTSDSHSIYSLESGRRLNTPGPVAIGNHVWLGKEVIVSKGVTVASNVIIGAKAFVNRSITEENVIAAGIPARVVRTNVGWTRELMPPS